MVESIPLTIEIEQIENESEKDQNEKTREKKRKRDGIEINIEKVERNFKRNKLDYINKLENEKEIGEQEKKEKLRQREKLALV